ncbi:MAG TPA: two-component regulator propeller domain-containing protein, partial [Thermoanaerobaculia bacterium]|nr:two-component regulator propeller domain-containing protein [Thermoanaerobaculia bacterium]
MPRRGASGLRIWVPALLAGALALSAAATAERLPIRVYTVDDGLAGDEINSILQDSRGFLWIGTDSGLSRFDGTRFFGYDPRQGLPSPHVTALLETASGGLLVGSTGGLARLDLKPTAASRIFKPVPDAPKTPNAARRPVRISALLADGSSTWLADSTASGGLFRLHPAGDRVGLEEVKRDRGQSVAGATSLALDGAGGLWVGTPAGLLHRLAEGRWIEVPVLPPRPSPGTEGISGIGALLLDTQHRLWIATAEALYVLKPGPADSGSLFERAAAGRCSTSSWSLPETPGEVCRFDSRSGFAGVRRSGSMLQTRDGKIWMTTNAGLSVFDGQRFRTYTRRHGLLPDELVGLAEDRDGNLWVGTRSHGLMRLAHNGFVTYGAAEDSAGPGVGEIFEDSESNLYVWGGERLHSKLFVFDGEQLRDVTPEVIEHAGILGRGRHQIVMPDASGEIWLGGAQGIWRLPKVDEPAALKRAPKVFWKAPAEMGEISRLFEDSHGRLWVSSLGNPQDRNKTFFSRWDRDTGRFTPVAVVERLGRGAPSTFAEDPYGNLWIGFSAGGLVRMRGETADLFLTGGGLPLGSINDLLVDSRQRLWVASANGGVIRMEDLNAPQPRTIVYTGSQGLSSDRVLCVTEDRRGLIYLGHGRGIDQLDPQTGRIRTLTAADGLPSRVVNVAFRAHDGSLWFGTPSGPSRYLPETPRIEAPPPIFLSAVRIGGVPLALPPLGLHDFAGLELPAERNQLEVRFIGISFAYGAGLRYQYEQEGNAAGWSEPRAERSVLLGNLAPGRYRFLFRAVTPDNVASPSLASLSFTLLPPYWQRWWFVLLVAAAAVAVGWTLHRAQVSRLLELERVRTRIAADLHDDLSSSLSRISILSELGRRRMTDPEAMEATILDQIGETARELIEATGDIVWAIDTRRGDLESLLARIRRFAGDLLEARGVSVLFAAPPRAAEIVLRPEMKRELYLVLKEALHNAGKHAQAQKVWIEVVTSGRELVAEVRDDGVGFAGDGCSGNGHSGNGLRNLRERAARLGGTLAVDSAPGKG